MSMPAVQAAGLWVGLLVVLMLGLKVWVGAQRRKHKVASGDTHPEFSRAMRVQLNAVEDVPALMAGILGLAMLNAPALYIHVVGAVLLVSRLLHASGLAGSGGFSIGRLVGTIGTYLAGLAIAGALIARALHLL